MKTKRQLQISATIFLFIASLTLVPAQPAPPAPPTPQVPAPSGGGLDPATGLPLWTPAQPWTDPNWQEPAKLLDEINYDGLPISEVARQLRLQFTNNLDIIIPQSYTVSHSTTTGGQPETSQPGNDYAVTLKLKYVHASEIFNGMNLEFEAENTPLRWQLIMNGGRSTAVLRILSSLLPQSPPPTPQPGTKRMVFYVGDLIGPKESGGMTFDQVREAVDHTHFEAFHSNINIGEYRNGELLIISGAPDDVDFVHQTLEALKQKVDSVRSALPPPPPAANATAPVPLSGASAGAK
jgi:hypothetical protein